LVRASPPIPPIFGPSIVFLTSKNGLLTPPQPLSTAWIFPLYFELSYVHEKLVFRKRDLLLRWKVPASLSLFLKSEKIPALLYIGRGRMYRPFCDLRSVPEAQITEGPVLTLFHYNSCTNRKIGKIGLIIH
jgi:hypothetical protein